MPQFRDRTWLGTLTPSTGEPPRLVVLDLVHDASGWSGTIAPADDCAACGPPLQPQPLDAVEVGGGAVVFSFFPDPLAAGVMIPTTVELAAEGNALLGTFGPPAPSLPDPPAWMGKAVFELSGGVVPFSP